MGADPILDYKVTVRANDIELEVPGQDHPAWIDAGEAEWLARELLKAARKLTVPA